MKNLEYRLSIDTIKALTGLKSLNNEQKKLDSSANNLDKSLNKESVALKRVSESASKSSKSVNDLANSSDKLKSASSTFQSFAKTAVGALATLFAVDKIVEFGKASVEAFKLAESGYKAFASSVKANGESMYDAMNAVNEITKNGGITSTQAQEALVNYMRMGFDVKSAKEQILREMDLATERRQAHYKTAGEAVVVASQGFLQENSTNSDASGNSKNVSKIYEEYAKSVNKTVEQLSKLDKQKAIVNESMKVHIEVAGAAARAMDTLAGAEAALDVEFTKTKETVGQALAPAYILLVQALKFVVTSTRSVISSFKEFGVSIAHISGLTGAFFNLLKSGDLKKFNKELEDLAKARRESIRQIEKEANGAYFSGQEDKRKQAKKEVKKTNEELEAEEARSNKNKLAIEKLGHEKSLIQLKLDLEDKKIELEKFKEESKRILGEVANIDIKLKNIDLSDVKKNLSASGLEQDVIQSLKLREAEIEKELIKIKEDSNSKVEAIEKTGSNNSSSSSKSSSKNEILQARLSATKSALDSEYSLYKESASRQSQVIQEKFNSFEISAEEYYSSMKKLADEDFNHQVKLAQAELTKAKSVATSNESERINKLANVQKLESDLMLIQQQRANVLASLTDEQARYVKELERYNSELEINKNANRATSNIELKRIDADVALASNRISGEERIKIEQDIQNELYAINLKALQERQKLSKDPREIANINAEIENIELQHSVTMKQISADLYVEQRKAYEYAMSQVRNFGDEVIDDLFNGFKNLESILDRAAKQIFANLFKQVVGYEELFKEDGQLSKLMSWMTNKPSSMSSPALPGSTTDVATGLLGGASSTTGAMSVSAGTVVIGGANAMSSVNEQLTSKVTSIFDSITSSISNVFSSFVNSASSLFSSFGGGGGSSLMSGLGSIFSSMMSFDVGADNLSRDMIAKVHKGERILTKRENKTASPLLDNPAEFIRKHSAGGGNQVVNHYNFANPVDRRTSDQLSAQTASAIMRAQRNI